jgi:hypothetical protein
MRYPNNDSKRFFNTIKRDPLGGPAWAEAGDRMVPATLAFEERARTGPAVTTARAEGGRTPGVSRPEASIQ